MRIAVLGVVLAGCRFGFTDLPRPLGDASALPDTTSPIDATLPGCLVPSAGSVACYPFDGSGTDAAHQDNATTTAVTYAAGKVGQAVHLDASSVITAATPAMAPSSAGTVTAWIRPDALPATGARAVVVDTNNYGMSVLPAGDLECFFTGVHHTFAAAITVGTWAHVACAYDGSAVTFWKDGVVVASQADSGPVMTNPSHLQIGSNIPDPQHPNPDLFVGAFDEVGIWNVPLTTADVCAAAGSC